MRESYKPGQNDYNDIVQKIISANADIVYVGGYAGEAGTLIRQLRDLVSQAHLVGGQPVFVEQFWSVAGTSGEGALVTFAPDPQKEGGPRSCGSLQGCELQSGRPHALCLRSRAGLRPGR